MSHTLLKCLVVDDEKPARQLLESYIGKTTGIELVKSSESALEALRYLEEESVDLAFLDIQMPELTGIEFLTLVQKRIPAVIFTTAYKEYALKGYEFGVIDYLLKPFGLDRFMQSVVKAKELIQLKQAETIPKTLAPRDEESSQSFFVKSGQKIVKIEVPELAYVEGMKEYVALHLASGQRIMTYQRMKTMEDVLQGRQFVRIHRSYIINTHYLTEIDGGQLKILDKWLPVGGNYKEVLGGFLDNLV